MRTRHEQITGHSGGAQRLDVEGGAGCGIDTEGCTEVTSMSIFRFWKGHGRRLSHTEVKHEPVLLFTATTHSTLNSEPNLG